MVHWLVWTGIWLSTAFSLDELPVDRQHIRVILEARYHTELSAEITSKVIVIDKPMGQAFKKGDVLMQLDDTVYKFNQMKAAAKLSETEAKRRAAEKLYEDKVASLSELKEARAHYAEARSDLTMAQKQLNDCTLIAPYEGKVQDVLVELFERVEPGRKLMEILDDSVLLARFFAPSEQLANVKSGMAIDVRVQETNMVYPGIIKKVAPGIDPASSLFKVEAEINNKNGELRPGMIGAISLQKVQDTHARNPR